MAADLIRCPGCGVKMDLASFAVRPDQVICPRCNTRSIVPRQRNSATYIDAVLAAPETPAPQMQQPTGSIATQPLPDQQLDYRPQAQTVPLDEPAGAAPDITNALPALPTQITKPRITRPDMPARQDAPPDITADMRPVQRASETTGPIGVPKDMPESAFFQTREQDVVPKMEVLPIDARGNTEPFVFALLGFLSTFLLFPPIGLALCIVGLLMNAEGKRRGLMCYHGGATTAFGIIGIILNSALLLMVLAAVIMLFASPTMFLQYLL